ncbi:MULTISPECIES: hypothetical protein [Asticcacaulis]|uniref:hypothetical protein n=1 Tax=Asticcacaulis TaxID=76890 RepID=UPI001AE4C149|nr:MULTISPECIES: hypothetical protein [Asticcacaulis]MBP2161314.1 hypothetical protein [Asticcacaulis solisilvae]MDR6802320.1 hypothetical protein [Asticcacaulis sp. BE141]
MMATPMQPTLAVIAALLLAACTPAPGGEGDASPEAAVEASASMIGGTAEWDNGDSVSFDADTTPAPKAAKFAKDATVWHRKSDYYEATLKYEGDFRKIPEVFAADFAKRRALMDESFVTYGGRKGQTDNWQVTVTLDSLTPRLVALVVSDWGFVSGAAHGSGSLNVGLWDRATLTQVEPDSLFIADVAVPEAEMFACDRFLAVLSDVKREALCAGGYFGKAPSLAGFVTKGGKFTGVVVQTTYSYASGRQCVSVPYRLFKAKVAEGWRDQFADDPAFVAKAEETC